jgi:hypothetical protein
MTAVEAYSMSQRAVRQWVVKNNAPRSIERTCIALVAGLLMGQVPPEQVFDGTLDGICSEQLRKYVEHELDEDMHK